MKKGPPRRAIRLSEEGVNDNARSSRGDAADALLRDIVRRSCCAG
jgi:hypothetical protein